MKLKLKHLAPYLPYDLNMLLKKDTWIDWKDQEIKPLRVLWFNDNQESIGYKPILRPLSDLTPELLKELRDSENKDLLLWGVRGFEGDLTSCNKYSYELTYHVLEWLYKNHIDVFGLIDKELAINRNTIIDDIINEDNEIDNFSDRFHPNN